MDPRRRFAEPFTRSLRRWIGRLFQRDAIVPALSVLLVSAAACSSVPPNLPTSEAFKRNVPRVELVPLVMDDDERAKNVRGLYLEIEALMLGTKEAQAQQWRALLQAKDRKLGDDEVRTIIRKFRDAELGALRAYIDIQMRLRKTTTPEEFARLDGLK